MVHPHRSAPTVFRHKRTIHERLGRSLRQSPIAASHLYTGKTQLARHTLWHQVARRIHDEVPVVAHTLSYGYVLYPLSWRYAIIRGIVRTLRRTIHVDNLNVVAIHAVHLLATTRRKPDGQVVEGVQQQTRHGCRVATARNLMVYQELAYGVQVFAYLCRHDVERTAQRQHGIHILDVSVERKTSVPAYSVGSRQFLHVDDYGYEVAQSSLMQHSPLGLAR